jgi:hypothetical protein
MLESLRGRGSVTEARATTAPSRVRLDRLWRAAKPALAIAGGAYLLASVLGIIPFTLQRGVAPGLDTIVYWGADLDNLYVGSQIGEREAFLYSPAFAQVLFPLRFLPFEVVYGLWLGVSIAMLVWMRVAWTLAFPPVLADLYWGNVHVLYALVIVLGFRVAALWALPILTKGVSGIGVLWFAFRAEWRPFALALGASAAIALTSFVLAPGLWFDWVDSIAGNVGRETGMRLDVVPLPVRLIAALGVLFWGARTDRRWVVPVAVFLASPTIWPGSGAVLVAAVSPRLRDEGATAPSSAQRADEV